MSSAAGARSDDGAWRRWWGRGHRIADGAAVRCLDSVALIGQRGAGGVARASGAAWR